MSAAVSVSPNSSPDGSYPLSTSEPALLAASLTALNAMGRMVRRETASVATTSCTLDLSNLPSGFYAVQLSTPHGIVTQK